MLPNWLSTETWNDWCEYRKAKSGRAWTKRAQELSLKKLGRLVAQGFDPTEVIEQSIECGWAGLFPVKGNQMRTSFSDYTKEMDNGYEHTGGATVSPIRPALRGAENGLHVVQHGPARSRSNME